MVTEVLDLLASGKVVPAIYEPVYPGLESVARGLDDLDKRKVWGRAVVQIRKSDAADKDGRQRAKL